MEISFESKYLRKLCEDNEFASSQMRKDSASALKVRLADLRAANSMNDIISIWPDVKINASNCKISIGENYVMMITANHNTNPLTDEGDIQWENVSRVRVLEIND